MDNTRPRISVEYTGAATMVSLMDEKILDQADIQAIEDSIMPLIKQAEQVRLILDFSNVEFLSSAMLGVLIRLSKRVYERDGKLGLCGISPQIYKIFKITRLDRIFDIYKDAATAVSNLSGTSGQ